MRNHIPRLTRKEVKASVMPQMNQPVMQMTTNRIG
ncbi:hypothetical protein Uis1B_0205 [Bifidobacterium margollesii]|uniref:Uncharacterized protein n=1 Tax=Bifidobacterium margollesii TaxID=2020964 RepID=A0A2N5JD18_9BIFI|nr:hypothetical protein Uis1B_0205 [Bifidobacterium margollesii]